MIFCLPHKWLFANFVASTYCYRLGHVVTQNWLAKVILLSYAAHDMLGERIEVTLDAR
tara:strand:- start:58 stop:231 length:174 start_codon:yes stop_codon:yes gene_type:complete